MKLQKSEYNVLYWIARNGRTDFKRLSSIINLKKVRPIIYTLRRKRLIKISYRKRKIYGFMETQLGEEMIINKKYKKWYEEFGD